MSSWQTVSLGDVASVTMGQSPPGSTYNVTSTGVPLIQGNADIVGRRTLDRVWTTEPTKRVRKGDVVLTVRAPVGYTAIASRDACLGRGVCGLSAGIATRFLFHALVGAEPKWSILEQGSTFTSVNSAQVKNFEIAWPNNDKEGIAIASVLDDADALIETLVLHIAKKRDIKQGMMQELLSGRTRLQGFTGEWTFKKIGDFAEVKAGGTPSTAIPRYWGGDIRWMSSGEIHRKRVQEVEGRISFDGLRESAAQLLPIGTVLMALAGQGKTRGTVAVSRVELSTNQSIAGILPSTKHVPDFLYYNLDTRYDELRGESAGDGGRGGLNLAIIKRLTVFMPPLNEQVAIAQVLGDADDEIDALERGLESARAIKTGMMQELLSGRTRLPVEEVVA